MTDEDAASDPDGDGLSLNFDWSPDVVAAIAEALREPCEIYELSGRVKAALPEEVEDHLQAFIRALDYHARRSASRPETIDDIYGSMFSSGDGDAYPEPLTAVTPETVAAWVDATQLFTTSDVVVARLNDLLWCVKAQPRPDLYARTANAAFRRMWGQNALASLHRSDALVRALELAVELRDATLVQETVSEMVDAVRQTVADEEWAPGVAVPLIEALAGLREPDRPAELNALIGEARVRYADDPFIVEALQLLRMQRAKDADERRRIAAEAVHMWKQQADERGGLVGLSHLERALELARNEGLTAAAEDLRELLQQPRTPEELGMEKMATELSIPSDVVEGFLATFVETSSAQESLVKLGAHCPITDVDADADLVREQMRAYPLVHLFTTVVTNTEGMPLAHVTSDEQKFNHALTWHHSMSITLWGSFLREILQRLGAQGRLTAAEVQQLVQGQFVDEPTSEGVGKAYEDFLASDYEACLQRLLVRCAVPPGHLKLRDEGHTQRSRCGRDGWATIRRALGVDVPSIAAHGPADSASPV